MLKYIVLFPVVLLLLSCAQEKAKAPENKIEIYLTHHEIPTKNCVRLIESEHYLDTISNHISRDEIKRFIKFGLTAQMDTITKKCGRFKGKFTVSKEDLEGTPIVFDHEIKSFTLNDDWMKSGTIKIDSAANNRIRKRLKNDKNYFYGKQYVITYNDEIVFTGYFLNPFSSAIINWYTTSFIFYIDKIHCDRDVNIPEISTQKEFINAFRKTNRLIE